MIEALGLAAALGCIAFVGALFGMAAGLVTTYWARKAMEKIRR